MIKPDSGLAWSRRRFLQDQAPGESICFVFGDILVYPAQHWFKRLILSTRHYMETLAEICLWYGIGNMAYQWPLNITTYTQREKKRWNSSKVLYRLNFAVIRSNIYIVDRIYIAFRDEKLAERRRHMNQYCDPGRSRSGQTYIRLLLTDAKVMGGKLGLYQRMYTRQMKASTGSGNFHRRAVSPQIWCR